MTAEDPVVLVVEDDERLADMYAGWLAETYSVRTAYDGAAALERLDGRVDVVVLDRLMPGLSGDDVLERVLASEHSPRVALVTAVEPDADVASLPFDEYLTKPVFEGDLYHVVERLLTQKTYAQAVGEYRALTARRDTLDRALSARQRAATGAYDDLLAAIDDAAERAASADGCWRESERDATVFRRLAQHLEHDE